MAIGTDTKHFPITDEWALFASVPCTFQLKENERVLIQVNSGGTPSAADNSGARLYFSDPTGKVTLDNRNLYAKTADAGKTAVMYVEEW